MTPELAAIARLIENTIMRDKEDDINPTIRFRLNSDVHFLAEDHKSSPEIPTFIIANGVHSSTNPNSIDIVGEERRVRAWSEIF